MFTMNPHTDTLIHTHTNKCAEILEGIVVLAAGLETFKPV